MRHEVRKKIEEVLKRFGVANRYVEIVLCDPFGDIRYIYVEGLSEEDQLKLTDEIRSLAVEFGEGAVEEALEEVLKELGCKVDWVL